jgi:TonB-linked SusC/RagA family outer membrane protein
MKERFTRKLKFVINLSILILLVTNLTNRAYAQSIVKGKVVDETGASLPGATIKVKGTSEATVTDVNGLFSLPQVGDNAVIQISFVGYQPQEIIAKSVNGSTIKLVSQPSNLDEVVVVGYGTQKVKDVTGSIVHIDATQHENEHPVSVFDQLRANAPGLNIGQDVSASRGAPSIQIRGQNSLNAGTNPLIVLDGAIYSGGLSSINPEDIQSIDVLKDGSSAAIYGANSASGVIAITTKKGTTDKPVITANATIGVATLSTNEQYYSGMGFINYRVAVENSLHQATAATKPDEYANPLTLPSNITTAQWLAYDASSGDPTQVWLRRLGLQPLEITNYLAGNQTNWYNLSFQKGLQQDYTVSVSGKGPNVTYYWSGDYQKNLGIIPGDQFGVYRNRLNLEAKVTSFITVGMNTVFSVKDAGGEPLGGQPTNGVFNWGSLVSQSPYGSLYNAAGTDYSYQPVGNANSSTNALGTQKYNTRVNMTYSLNSSLYAHITLPLGIKFSSTFTPYLSFYNDFEHASSAWPDYSSVGGTAYRETSTTYNWQLDNVLTWDKTFNSVHHFNVTVGQNASKDQYWDTAISNSLFSPNDALGYHGLSLGTAPVISANPPGGSNGSDTYSTAAAYFGRLSYAYDDRYLLNATFRRDGNSSFGQSNPWGNFPSIGLGWVFTKEKFVKEDWLDYGKLRLTYSQNGNSNINSYAALAKIGGGQVLNVNTSGAVVTTSELYANQLPNYNLQWEKTASLNAGLDFTLLKGVLSGSMEAYYAKTTDLLASRTLPSVTGFASVEANLGQVNNKGFEVSLNSRNINNQNLTWTTSASFTLNRNTIIHLYGNYVNGVEQNDINNGWFIGQNIHTVWDYKVLGVYQNDQAAQAAKYSKQPGDFNLQDVNGDGIYTNADKQFLGNTTPNFRWTLSNQFIIHKDFTFSFLIYSNWGQLAQFNQAKNSSTYIERFNFEVQPYWTPTNPTNDFARLQSNDAGTSYNIWRDASFIRLDNVSAGYIIPRRLVNIAHIQSMKLFATVRNALVWSKDRDWTKYDWDPETMQPTPRTYTIGLNVTL